MLMEATEPDADPQPPRVQDWFPLVYRRNANSLATRFGAPVWLVGGALEDTDPRDFDVRIFLADEDFARMYGRKATAQGLEDFEPWEWLRGYDNLKLSRLHSFRMGRCLDVQIQSASDAARYAHLPRLRLDTAPDWVLAGGVDLGRSERERAAMEKVEQLELARLRDAIAPTPENKHALGAAVTWRGSETDFVTDLLDAIRKRADV